LNGPKKRNESNYIYDKTSQLINANYNFIKNESYNFDPNGNRKTAEIQGQKQTYQTGEYNRLLSDENYNYEYDLEGNRISKTNKKDNTITKYTWDHRNRLIKVTTSTTEVEYLYDYLNRLVKRIENKTDQKYFVHDNWQIVLQFSSKNSHPTNRYLWGTKQDEVICDNNNWTLGDHLNTIRDIVKSDGNVVAHLDYNSFGKIIPETKNDTTLSFAYTGKLFDQTSDLQWNVNRWYDSNVGRWVSEDPIGFRGRDVNLYRCVYNTFIAMSDPSGHVIQFVVPGGFITGSNGVAAVYSAVSAFSTAYTLYSITTTPSLTPPSVHDGGKFGPYAIRLPLADLTSVLQTIDRKLTYSTSFQMPDYPNFYVCTQYNGYDKVEISVRLRLYEGGLFSNTNFFTDSDSTTLTKAQLELARNTAGDIRLEFESVVMLRVHYIDNYIYDGIKIEASKYDGVTPFTPTGSAIDNYSTTAEVYAEATVYVKGYASTRAGKQDSTTSTEVIQAATSGKYLFGNFGVTK
jgi:RHS repeat-associated protein